LQPWSLPGQSSQSLCFFSFCYLDCHSVFRSSSSAACSPGVFLVSRHRVSASSASASLTVTVSSGHLVPQLAAPESSWSVVTQSECHRVKVIWFRSLQPQSLPCPCHSVKESESHKVIQFRLSQPWSLPCLCHESLQCIVMCLSIYTFLPLSVLVYRGLSFHIDSFDPICACL
jgi:hypothetical protein